MNDTVDAFLKKHGMHWDLIDFEREVDIFQKHMEDGCAGRVSSLMMLPSFIRHKDRLCGD